MNLAQSSMRNPYAILALALVVVVLGGAAFWRLPTDLFPDTVPPQVVVVTVQPGAAALDITDKITRPVETELSSISGLKRITSTTRDEVSSINVELLYSKPIGEAVIDVQNAVARVRGSLPPDIEEPRLYRITDATRPLVTLSLSPRVGSLKQLSDIRLLAENDLKDRLISIPGVGDVQVFGGHQPEVEVRVDRDALAAHGLTIGDVIGCLANQNVTSPGGTIYGATDEYLIKIAGELSRPRAFADLPVRVTAGGHVYLRDVATVHQGEADLRSLYHGNGAQAVALNILRPEQGNTVQAIKSIKATLPEIEARYPDIAFSITDDQQPLIDLNINGMRSSLLQAAMMSVVVIFVFLANLRAAAVVSVAIPLSFLAAMVVLWISPFTMNMVTLSGLIIAVGMVVDASVVVLENIYRSHSAQPAASPGQTAVTAASRVARPITAGMLTTVLVLLPVMFSEGYAGKIMMPLNLMIVSTLVASLLVSLTVVPVISARLLAGSGGPPNRLERLVAPLEAWMDRVRQLYLAMVARALDHKLLFLLGVVVLMAVSFRVVKPLLGAEQMPPMDTGISIIDLDMASTTRPTDVEAVLDEVEAVLQATPEVTTISSVVGSEPGAVSFGGGGAITQSAKLTVNLVPRTEREQTIWELAASWREQLRDIDGLRSFRISEYGATPVSTTKAPFNIVLSGPDVTTLDRLAEQVIERLRALPGLTDLRRSWYRDKVEQRVDVDPQLARLYGVSPAEVTSVLKPAVHGAVATTLRLDGYLSIPVRVRYQAGQVSDPGQLEEIPIPTRLGLVPLGNMATSAPEWSQPFITREDLRSTIDITGGNDTLTIAQVTARAQQRLEDLPLPRGYSIKIAGTAHDLKDNLAVMGRALVIGLLLLFLLLVALFKSFGHSLTIMSTIPMAAAGAMWGLLLFDKPFCMPALMGLILLGGTIVNNAILMLDFIIEARSTGMDKKEAILQSVQLRFRPIVMTAASTIIGLLPLVLEMAIGLERLSPLGIVAASGLLLGTVVTLVAVPVVYSVVDLLTGSLADLARSARRLARATGVLIALALISTTSAADQGAASGARSRPLDLKSAIELALRHNPDLDALEAQARLQHARCREVRSAQRIPLEHEASASQSDETHGMVPGASPSAQGFADRLYQGTVTASYLVTDLGASESRLQAAMSRHRAASLHTERRRHELMFEVASVFLRILSLDDLLEATEASRVSLRSLSRTADALVAHGRAPRLDSLKVNVRLAEVESSLAALEGQRLVSRATLGELVGLEDTLPELTHQRGLGLLRASGGPPPAAITDRAELLGRPDLRAAAAIMKSTENEVSAARRDLLPRLQLRATAGIYGAEDPHGAQPGAASLSREDDYTISLRLSLPLLDGGLRRARLAQSRAAEAVAESQHRKMLLAAHRELESARADLHAATSQLAANREAVEASDEALRIEALKYETGRGSINDVLDAEAARLRAQAMLHDAVRQVEVARLAEALALGAIDTEVDELE